MRILHVSEASAAGTLRIIETLCDGLARAGHDVTFAYGRRPETPETIGAESTGFDLVPLEWERRTVGAQVRAAGQLRRLVHRVKPDVIHLHAAFAGLVGGSLGSRHPRVYTPHMWASTYRDWRFQNVLGSALDRFVIRRCDLIGAVSDSEAADGRRLGARRLLVVPNGLPELDTPSDLLEPRSPRTTSPVVVSGGRLVASRRPAESARILRGVQDVARTRWIGDGLPDAVHAVRGCGVEVTGWLPHQEAVDQIGSATAYLHWTANDGQSVAVLEAMARDTVVIGSDIPPNRELLDRDQLFTDEAEATQMLRRVIESPDLRARLVAAQRVRGADHGADRMVRRWIDAYAQTIAAHEMRRRR